MSFSCLLLRVVDHKLAYRSSISQLLAACFRIHGNLDLRRLAHTTMPPKAPKEDKPTAIFGTKRKAAESADKPVQKPKGDFPAYRQSQDAERYGIIDRRFYPPEITNARCAQYNSNEIPRPIELLDDALKGTADEREHTEVHNSVVHWFKSDLRTKDNKALHLASEKAKANGVPLICIYIVSPQDFRAHITSAVRVDFILRTLEVLKSDLAKLDIPLYVETVEKRKNIPGRIFELCEKWGASHLFANKEYEVDELRREARMIREGLRKGIAFTVEPDTCVVAPGELKSGAGTQYAVYSPWCRAWMSYLHSHPHHLNLYPLPAPNPPSTRKDHNDLFDVLIPEAPANKSLTDEEKKRFRRLWPPGEEAANERLAKFLEERVERYKDKRNFPAANATAVVSVHLASGTLSARTAVANARAANSVSKLDGGHPGISGWIAEVAWRDFYKHVLAHWPFIW